jgi:hypothetical protein
MEFVEEPNSIKSPLVMLLVPTSSLGIYEPGCSVGCGERCW